MHIAILGTRGIPARYGGFETFAEELGKRLAARGHRVTVYGRERHTSNSYLGCELVYLPTIRHKYLDTVAHTFLSSLHLLFRRADVALFCNAANAAFTWMPRLAGIPVALNVDGLERNRRKWNWLGRLWYLWSERWSTWFPNRVVSDAEQIRRYYLDRYGADSDFIPYGADMERPETRGALGELGLEPMRYFLYVSRMEPENNALLVRKCFESVEGDVKLALIGDAPYAQDYIALVRNTRDPRIVMPGAVYGLGYRELGSHCLAYIHATEVGGTHPALIENMGRGALTLYLDTPENAEAAGDAGIPFTPETLAARMREVLAMSEDERNLWRDRARRRIAGRYSWEAVTGAYESLFRRLAG